MKNLGVAVVLIAFNRPKETRAILQAIISANPKKLYVLVDGPRTERPMERGLVLEVLREISKFEASLDISYLISEKNLGIRERVVSGLDWVFGFEESAIVLEDDCIPDPSFFDYCSELLQRYKFDEKVGVVSGFRPCPEVKDALSSYSFSNFTMTWGWATWKRVWETFDKSGSDWNELSARKRVLERLNTPDTKRYWAYNLDQVTGNAEHAGWDYLLALSQWMHGRVNIVPKLSLVKNVGFTMDATHTMDPTNPLARVSAGVMPSPLVHPDQKLIDLELDREIERSIFSLGRGKLLILKVLDLINSDRLNRLLAWIRWKISVLVN